MKAQNYGLFVEGNQLGHKGSDSTTRPPEQHLDNATNAAIELKRQLEQSRHAFAKKLDECEQIREGKREVTAQRDELLAAVRYALNAEKILGLAASPVAIKRYETLIAKCEANK